MINTELQLVALMRCFCDYFTSCYLTITALMWICMWFAPYENQTAARFDRFLLLPGVVL